MNRHIFPLVVFIRHETIDVNDDFRPEIEGVQCSLNTRGNMGIRSKFLEIWKWSQTPMPGDPSMTPAKMFKILVIFCVGAGLLVTPIMFFRHSDDAFMRLLWADGSTVMSHIKCSVLMRCPSP